MVSVACSVVTIVKKTVEKLVAAAGASGTAEVGLGRETPLDVATPPEVVRPLEVKTLPGVGSTTTVVVPVTKASVTGGVLSPSQTVVPFSLVK